MIHFVKRTASLGRGCCDWLNFILDHVICRNTWLLLYNKLCFCTKWMCVLDLLLITTPLSVSEIKEAEAAIVKYVQIKVSKMTLKFLNMPQMKQQGRGTNAQ